MNWYLSLLLLAGLAAGAAFFVQGGDWVAQLFYLGVSALLCLEAVFGFLTPAVKRWERRRFTRLVADAPFFRALCKRPLTSEEQRLYDGQLLDEWHRLRADTSRCLPFIEEHRALYPDAYLLPATPGVSQKTRNDLVRELLVTPVEELTPERMRSDDVAFRFYALQHFDDWDAKVASQDRAKTAAGPEAPHLRVERVLRAAKELLAQRAASTESPSLRREARTQHEAAQHILDEQALRRRYGADLDYPDVKIALQKIGFRLL